MKRIYLILPCLALTAFAGYYQHWKADNLAFECNRPRQFDPDPYTNHDGRKEAEADLAQGKLRLLGYGMPVYWAPEYREVMKRDYGVESEAIAGCVVSEGLVRYAAAYNEVMQPRIIARHGAHVFEDAAAKAVALYAERHPPKPAG